MISDRFAMESPGAIDRGNATMPGRDESNRESFVSTSLNCENFGDWAEAPISFSYRHDRVDAPFPEEKEEPNHHHHHNLNDSKNMSGNLSGFSILELKSNVPKLPVSKREIRKGSIEHIQPTIVFQKSLDAEQDYPISPIDMASPVANMMKAKVKLQSELIDQFKLQVEPSRNVKRSKSDLGGSPQVQTTPLKGGESPTPNRRSAFGASKNSELSLSFSQRRRPFANRPLLMQIAARRKSYRQLDIDEDENALQKSPMKRSNSYRLLVMDDDDDNDYVPPSPSPHRPQAEFAVHSTPRRSYSDDGDFEGTMPLKAASESVTVKKRSTSKDRLNSSSKSASEYHDSDDDGNQRQSRSGRRLKNRKASLTDSSRSNGSSKSNIRRGFSEDEFDFDFPTHTPPSKNQERNSLLADVRRMRTARRLSNEGRVRPRSRSRKQLEDNENEKTPQSKKKSGRDAQISATTPEEIKKYSSRCKNRKFAARRASMTGNIVDAEDDAPHNKRRSSMGHLKANTPQRPKRRSTMDHFTPASPSTASSATFSPEVVKPRSNLSAHMNEEKSPFLNRVPFSEEGTVTTKDTQDTPDLSNSFRRGPLLRKTSMDKARDSRHSKGRKNGRSRSQQVGERKRSSSKNPKKEFEQPIDKTVTVAEILAVVASSKPSIKSRRSRSNDPIDISDRSGSATGSSQSSPKITNRKSSRSRQGGKNALESSFHRIRKGKRVDQQPEEEREKRIVVGKETRHRGRRLSMR